MLKDKVNVRNHAIDLLTKAANLFDEADRDGHISAAQAIQITLLIDIAASLQKLSGR